MSTMDRETEAWEKRNKAINVFKQLIKDESISKEKMDEQVLGLYNLLTPNKEKDRIPLIKPSNVKISIDDDCIDMLELIFKINSEKHIFLLNKSSPKLLIAKEIFEKISKNCANKK